MIDQLIHGVFSASLCSTAFIFLFISLRKVIIKYIGASWVYYMWFSVFIPWIAIWFPPYYFWMLSPVLNVFRLINPILLLDLTHKPILSKIFILLTNGSKYSLILTKLLFIIWLSGALISSLYVVFRHLQYVFILKQKSRRLNNDEQERIEKLLTNKQRVYLPRIYLSTAVSSPMLCHIINSKIYLPNNFFSYFTLAEQEYVLSHEFFHFQRHDLLANAVMLMLGCINWFNPIILLSYRYFRNCQELACDSKVCKRFSAIEKKSYGYALLKTVTNQSSEDSKISCWWNTGIELKERCQMLKFNQSMPIKISIGMIIFLCTVYSILAGVSLQNRDTLFFYSVFSAKGSDFVIKIFNNTNMTQPLHYLIKSSNQRVIEGQLFEGDNQGEFITINGSLHDKSCAEITMDRAGDVIWKEVVLFTENKSEIYTKIISLNPDYEVGTNIFGSIHAISFDIRKRINN